MSLRCKYCDEIIPHTSMNRKHRVCIGCRSNRPHQQEWAVIFQSNDGLYYGTDYSAGSMDRIGACTSVQQALDRMGSTALAPDAWLDEVTLAVA